MINLKPRCPYCQRTARLVLGDVIYPHREDLHELHFWLCKPCDAYVGCHAKGAFMLTRGGRVYSDGTLPLGRLADPDLRIMKTKAHQALDPFWRDRGVKGLRNQVYARLAQDLNIDPLNCHIGMFDINTCQRVIEICQNWRAQCWAHENT